MTPESFVTLLIVAWLGLAGVTLWAFLRVPRRRARLQRKARQAENRDVYKRQFSTYAPANGVMKRNGPGWTRCR